MTPRLSSSPGDTHAARHPPQSRHHLAAALTATATTTSTATPEPSARRRHPRPLRRAHAHNDYLHRRPLLDALDHRFTSVEADIFLVDGQLLVAHEPAELDPSRTLESLYLDPLRARVHAGGGSVYPGWGGSLRLLIDLKTEGASTRAGSVPAGVEGVRPLGSLTRRAS